MHNQYTGKTNQGEVDNKKWREKNKRRKCKDTRQTQVVKNEKQEFTHKGTKNNHRRKLIW